MKADLVLIDCNVLTMNPSQSHAEAVAIKAEKIVKVGTIKQVKQFVGKETKVIELNGSTIVPGLIDTHIHIADFGRFLTWIDLNSVKSIKEMQVVIKKNSEELPKNKWILGRGWNQINFVENRMPNSQDIDEVSLNHPVILYHQSGCMCLVNSKALHLAKITSQKEAPKGGTIDYNPKNGEPTGILHENAMSLIWKLIPEPNQKEVFDSASIACRKVVEAGVTSVHWIVSSVSEIQLIQQLSSENKLPMRVYVIYPVDILEKLSTLGLMKDSDANWLHIGGIKIFVDGSLAERTAALKEPYNDDSNTKGKLFYTQEELKTLVTRLHKANFPVIIHAMGDQALDMTVTILEKILNEYPKKNHRYRIEQAAVLNKDLIKRIKRLGVSVGVQPCTIISEFTAWSAVARLGEERARLLYPLKTLLKEFIPVIGGSDCPMELVNPFLAIKAAVTRPFFPKEQIAVGDALRMYTVNAAYASFDENLKGTIDEGKLADLTVISCDPTTILPSQLDDIQVEMTIIGGKIVYSKEKFLVYST